MSTRRPRTVTRGAARRARLAAIAAVTALIATGCASGDRVTDRRAGQQLVCHHGKETLAVSTADMFVHEQHGDSLGPCPNGG